MIVEVYTDASYNEKLDIASCGILVLVNKKIIKHEVVSLLGLGTVSNAEIWAVVHGLQYCFMVKDVSKIYAYTDHKTILTRRGKKLKYRDLDDTIEMIADWGIPLKLIHVYAHRNNFYNNKIDQSCRQELRKYVKQFRENKQVFSR